VQKIAEKKREAARTIIEARENQVEILKSDQNGK
jgi:hypothetical protein